MKTLFILILACLCGCAGTVKIPDASTAGVRQSVQSAQTHNDAAVAANTAAMTKAQRIEYKAVITKQMIQAYKKAHHK
jgi:hypothetical protein